MGKETLEEHQKVIIAFTATWKCIQSLNRVTVLICYANTDGL